MEYAGYRMKTDKCELKQNPARLINTSANESLFSYIVSGARSQRFSYAILPHIAFVCFESFQIF